MKRKMSLSLYGAAFLISLAVFIAGVFVGSVLDTTSTQTISEEISRVSERVSSVQLLLLMEANSSSFCPVYLSELESIDEDVENFGHRLSYLESEKNVHDVELKKQYFVLEAESYLLSQKVRGLCGDDSVLLVHFYSNSNCSRCEEQGAEILRARDGLDRNVKLFSFDGDIGSPVAEAFMNRYNIRTYPSVVINGKRYSGFRSAEELQELISEAQ
ncbi:hypothetical protein GF318_02190 [Candidatus Micrarchaeota archaeon]|nr:hypothetical protein [Candidatus Micrarchaeota archaeon]